MKRILAILVFPALLFCTACETCTDCSVTFTDAMGEEQTLSGDFCSEDSDEVTAFENSFAQDAAAAGAPGTGHCSR